MDKKQLAPFALAAAITLLLTVACGTMFPDEGRTGYLTAPVISTDENDVLISWNADASIAWTNIFRRDASSQENAFVSIGQVLPNQGSPFSNSANFVDPYCAPDTKYEYYIRHAYKNGASVTYKRTNQKVVVAPAGGKGVWVVGTAGTTPLAAAEFVYDKERHTLVHNSTQQVAGSSGPATASLMLVLSNGSTAYPCQMEEATTGSGYTYTIDLRKQLLLAPTLLNKEITCTTVVAQEKIADDKNLFTTYRWSQPVGAITVKDGEGNAVESISVPISAMEGTNVDY